MHETTVSSDPMSAEKEQAAEERTVTRTEHLLQRIRERMGQQDMAMRELARRLDVSHVYVQKQLRAERLGKESRFLVRVCEELGIPIDLPLEDDFLAELRELRSLSPARYKQVQEVVRLMVAGSRSLSRAAEILGNTYEPPTGDDE